MLSTGLFVMANCATTSCYAATGRMLPPDCSMVFPPCAASLALPTVKQALAVLRREAVQCWATAQPRGTWLAGGPQQAAQQRRQVAASVAATEAPPMSKEKQELSKLMNKEYKCVRPSFALCILRQSCSTTRFRTCEGIVPYGLDCCPPEQFFTLGLFSWPDLVPDVGCQRPLRIRRYHV